MDETKEAKAVGLILYGWGEVMSMLLRLIKATDERFSCDNEQANEFIGLFQSAMAQYTGETMNEVAGMGYGNLADEIIRIVITKPLNETDDDDFHRAVMSAVMNINILSD